MTHYWHSYVHPTKSHIPVQHSQLKLHSLPDTKQEEVVGVGVFVGAGVGVGQAFVI